MSSVRDTYMKDYGITEHEVELLLEYCRSADKEQQAMILNAVQITNDCIAVPLFINLTSGIGYDRISDWYFIPMQRKDFQGYRRKALKILKDLIVMHKETEKDSMKQNTL
ncbi:MAG: hypothetical protein ACOX8H_09660 [Ruminococcus sp.]